MRVSQKVIRLSSDYYSGKGEDVHHNLLFSYFDLKAFDDLKTYLNLSQREFTLLENEIDVMSIKTHRAIQQAMILDGVLGKREKLIDFMTIDLKVGQQKRILIPYVMEINDFASGGMQEADEARLTNNTGQYIGKQVIADWFETATHQAIRYKRKLEVSSSPMATNNEQRDTSAKHRFGKDEKDDIGGINLNANQLNIETQGKGIDFDIPISLESLQNIPLQGLSPVIYQIIPVTNFNLLLGLEDQEEEVDQSELSSLKARDPMRLRERSWAKKPEEVTV